MEPIQFDINAFEKEYGAKLIKKSYNKRNAYERLI